MAEREKRQKFESYLADVALRAVLSIETIRFHSRSRHKSSPGIICHYGAVVRRLLAVGGGAPGAGIALGNINFKRINK